MSKSERSDEETAPSLIENRVYLFESLARAFIEKSADELSGKNLERRARAIRALADLAYVSCAVADTEQLSAKGVRKRVLAAIALEAPTLGVKEEDGERD